MKPTLEIFSQGEEIVCGQIADTNAAWLSQQAVQLGFLVTRHTAVGDKLDDLVGLLKEIAERADCCLCTGGLGPTTDDLTAQAVAEAFGLPLVFDAVAFAQIQDFFTRRQRVMPDSNRKQALLPKGSQRLDNALGTAPGFSVQAGRCWFAFMPGVPSEMRHLFAERILPTLSTRFALTPDRLITLKSIGIGESAIQELLRPITLPEDVAIGYRASVGEVQIKLLFPHNYPEDLLGQFTDAIAAPLGDKVFAVDDSNTGHCSDLVGVIDALMGQRQLRLAVLETVSRGCLGSLCPTADWLLSSAYYQGVASGDTVCDGNETVQSLAADLIASGADCALVQAFTDNKEIFAVRGQSTGINIYLLTPDASHLAQYRLSGPSGHKQQQAALLSLDVLRRYLQGCLA